MSEPIPGLVLLRPDEVRPAPNNPRLQVEDIEELAQSIEQVGLIQPIVVQRVPADADHAAYFEIVAGHRRFAALKLLHRREIPAIVRRPMPPAQALVAKLVENQQRSGLDPIEEAKAYKALHSGGHTLELIATKVGKPLSHVSTRLSLLELSITEQEAIRAGHWTLQHGIDVVRGRRQQVRQSLNPVTRGPGRPKGSKAKPYFGDTHPLHETASAHCTHGKGHVKIPGALACGPCLEEVIRADERTRIEEDIAEECAPAADEHTDHPEGATR